MSDEKSYQDGVNAAHGMGMPPSPGNPAYLGYLDEQQRIKGGVGGGRGSAWVVGLVAIGIALYYFAAIAMILVIASLTTAFSILLLSQKFAATNPIRFPRAIKISVAGVLIYGALTGIAGYLAFFQLDPYRFSFGDTMMTAFIHQLHYTPEHWWYSIKSLPHFKQAMAEAVANATPIHLAIGLMAFLVLLSPGAIASGAYFSKRVGPPFHGKTGFLWACLFTVVMMIVVSFLVASANSGFRLYF